MQPDTSSYPRRLHIPDGQISVPDERPDVGELRMGICLYSLERQ